MSLGEDLSVPRAKPPGPEKAKFSVEDDDRLLAAVMRLGTSHWDEVAREVGARNARQCRDRWRNYVNPSLIQNNPWTDEEDAILVSQVAELGAKWMTIVQLFPSRSINNLKNRYHMLQRVNASFRRRKYDGSRQSAKPRDPVTLTPTTSEDDPFQFLESLRPELEREFAFGLDSTWDNSWVFQN
jgi:hypothetical protein